MCRDVGRWSIRRMPRGHISSIWLRNKAGVRRAHDSEQVKLVHANGSDLKTCGSSVVHGSINGVEFGHEFVMADATRLITGFNLLIILLFPIGSSLKLMSLKVLR